MAELRKDARKHHEEKAEREHQQKAESARRLEAGRQAAEERDKRAMFNSWVAQGGAPSAFEAAWPDLRAQMLKQRTLEGENAAREGQRATAFLEMNDPSSRSRDHLRASAAPRTRS
jgi:hypothetical protein